MSHIEIKTSLEVPKGEAWIVQREGYEVYEATDARGLVIKTIEKFRILGKIINLEASRPTN